MAAAKMLLGAPRILFNPNACDVHSRQIRAAAMGSNSYHEHDVPKLEPFNRSITSRWMKERSLIEKAEHALEDQCSVLEGDQSYECWQALFEFEDLKKGYEAECAASSGEPRSLACQPLERLKTLIRQSSGVTALLNNLRMLLKRKRIKEMQRSVSAAATGDAANASEQQEQQQENDVVAFFEPGSFPKSKEELEEDQNALMPDSGFTRLLRRRGTDSKWFNATDM